MADRLSGSYASLSDADHAACSRSAALHCRFTYALAHGSSASRCSQSLRGVLTEDAPHEGGVEDTLHLSPIVLLLAWICTYVIGPREYLSVAIFSQIIGEVSCSIVRPIRPLQNIEPYSRGYPHSYVFGNCRTPN